MSGRPTSLLELRRPPLLSLPLEVTGLFSRQLLQDLTEVNIEVGEIHALGLRSSGCISERVLLAHRITRSR